MSLSKSTKVAVIIPDLHTAGRFFHEKDVLLEMRFDLDMELLALKRFPENTILTYRSQKEGGKGKNNSEERKPILLELAKLEKGFLDIEINQDREVLEQLMQSRRDPNRIILSSHDYSETMGKSTQRYLTQVKNLHHKFPQLKMAIHKFVGMPDDALDLIEGINNLASLSNRVVLGIGTIGEFSRTLPVGNQFVFGTVTNLQGIMDFNKLKQIHDCKNPIFTGLIGKSLDHSLSPHIHGLLFENAGLCGHYHLFPLKEATRIRPFIEEIKKFGVKGFNVTFPYKEEAARIAEIHSKEVRECGAANTLSIEGDEIKAYNTDITGFARMIEENNLKDANSALIVGAGGAAKAVAYALMQLGIEVLLYNRNKLRYKHFSGDLRDHITFLDRLENVKSDLYINTTPLGMDGNGSPTELVPFPKQLRAVIDVAYTKGETGLVREAIEKGLPWIDGKEMLFHQAIDAFEIWTGKSVNRKSLMETWLKEVKHNERN